jgi:PBP1b-binding outer membrane lipoprotein LpoB
MRILLGLLLLTGCAQEREPAPAKAETQAQVIPPAPVQPQPVLPQPGQPQAGQSSALMAIPEDPQAVKKLEAMGYTIHMDHLHAPGVTVCPKMGNDPVV